MMLDFEKDADGRITFEAFVKAYGPARPDQVAPHHDEYTRGFLLHTRVPDGRGRFGADAQDAEWCDPTDWHRRYYEARRRQYPDAFSAND